MSRRFRTRLRRLPARALNPAALGLAGFAEALLLRRRRSEATQPEAVDDDFPEPRRRFYYRKHRRFF